MLETGERQRDRAAAQAARVFKRKRRGSFFGEFSLELFAMHCDHLSAE